MNSNPAALKSIAIEYLFAGMVVAENIFSYDGRMLLVARGIELTENKIRQLKKFDQESRNVLVSDITYKALIERGIPPSSTLAQGYLEDKIGYADTKNKAFDMLNTIKEADAVTHNDTDSISGEINDALQKYDPSLIFQCINAPKPINEYLRRHCINVGMINGLMGKWLNLSPERVAQLVLSGLVHDVGKTKIPSEILDAPRKLAISEFEVMKMHPIYSYNLLNKDESFSEEVRLAARHHHEKMNGGGYPDKLTRENISLFAKITAVSDIYDAMVSKRSYKDANNPFFIMAKMAGQQFLELDAKLVKLFTERMPAELVGKPVLLSDGSIGKIRFIMPSDLEHPLVEVNGEVKRTDQMLYCKRVVFE